MEPILIAIIVALLMERVSVSAKVRRIYIPDADGNAPENPTPRESVLTECYRPSGNYHGTPKPPNTLGYRPHGKHKVGRKIT